MALGSVLSNVAGNVLGGLLGGGNSGTQPPFQYSTDSQSSSGSQGSQNQSSSFSSQDPASVWGPQQSYLTNLYSQAQGQLQGGGQAEAQANNLLGQGYTGIEQLLNPGINPMLQVYQEQLQRGMEQNILPAIRRESAGFGQYGGTRQGVAEGLAAQEAGRMSREFAAQVYGQDRDRQLGAAQTVPALASAGLGVPWYGLNQMAGILGQPTVLAGGSVSGSQSTGSSFGVTEASGFGESFSSPDRSDVPFPGQVPAAVGPTGFADVRNQINGGFGNQN